ncbi:hypothetical protein K431DRAFT_16213 [Polychaeton citri CBS 116435]|uniref:Uncharacterized protein n=1 Tax=Polychaeton citri CBS 116435 TaxID=1314669 RepID=A0A9P4QFB1_9PEZI|nr:hypothetical protein K431DRAFT_16213 [Polychaeton citri CBS 116435]
MWCGTLAMATVTTPLLRGRFFQWAKGDAPALLTAWNDLACERRAQWAVWMGARRVLLEVILVDVAYNVLKVSGRATFLHHFPGRAADCSTRAGGDNCRWGASHAGQWQAPERISRLRDLSIALWHDSWHGHKLSPLTLPSLPCSVSRGARSGDEPSPSLWKLRCQSMADCLSQYHRSRVAHLTPSRVAKCVRPSALSMCGLTYKVRTRTDLAPVTHDRPPELHAAGGKSSQRPHFRLRL